MHQFEKLHSCITRAQKKHRTSQNSLNMHQLEKHHPRSHASCPHKKHTAHLKAPLNMHQFEKHCTCSIPPTNGFDHDNPNRGCGVDNVPNLGNPSPPRTNLLLTVTNTLQHPKNESREPTHTRSQNPNPCTTTATTTTRVKQKNAWTDPCNRTTPLPHTHTHTEKTNTETSALLCNLLPSETNCPPTKMQNNR